MIKTFLLSCKFVNENLIEIHLKLQIVKSRSIRICIAYCRFKYTILVLNYKTAQLNSLCERGQKYLLCNELLFYRSACIAEKEISYASNYIFNCGRTNRLQVLFNCTGL